MQYVDTSAARPTTHHALAGGSFRSTQETLQALLQLVATQSRANGSYLARVSQDGDRAVVTTAYATPGEPPLEPGAVLQLTENSWDAIAGTTEPQRVVVRPAGGSIASSGGASEPRTYTAVPVTLSDGTLFGVLLVAGLEEHAGVPSLTETLTLFARLLATQIERGRNLGEHEQRWETNPNYREVVERIPALTYISALDERGTTLYISPQIERLLGFTTDEWRSDPDLWTKRLHPDDCERVLSEHRHANATANLFRIEYRLLAKDGRVVWVHDDAAVVRDDAGRPQYWLGILLDITERKQAEEALRLNEERFHATFQRAALGMVILDESGYPMQCNTALEQMLGYTRTELCSKSFAEFVHPEDIRMDAYLYQELVAGLRDNYQVQKRFIRKDGRLAWGRLIVSLLYSDKDKPRYALGLIENITNRKVAQQALKESQDRYRSLVELSPQAIAVHSEGRVVFLNPAAIDLIGASNREEVIGTPITSFIPSDDLASMSEMVERPEDGNGSAAHTEAQLVRLDGRTLHVDVIASAVTYRGKPAYQLIIQDITERKQEEARRAELFAAHQEQSRRLRELAVMKADFTAMVAHELGSPLAAIRGYADMLGTGELTAAEQEHAVAAVRAEVDLLTTLVADVQAAATIEREDFTIRIREVQLAALLARADAFARTLPGNHPFTMVGSSDATVLADPERIGQVLRNLLSNAAKYSPDGAPIELRVTPSGGRVRIEVADAGFGIHPDDIARIFEKFGRGRDRSGQKVAGIGLGLYLSQRIVRAHGSELAVSPRRGRGTVFGFELEAKY